MSRHDNINVHILDNRRHVRHFENVVRIVKSRDNLEIKTQAVVADNCRVQQAVVTAK